MSQFQSGQEHVISYPFSRDKYMDFGEDFNSTPVEMGTWRPGVVFEQMDDYEAYALADAMGSIVLTIIATFKPGNYPTRVFYTRHWIDPDGKRFGKGSLRMTTERNFKVMLRGYRHHFELRENA